MIETLTIPDDFRPSAETLGDRVILLSGAAGGIGSAVARHCAAAGAQLILLDKAVKKLEALADEIDSADSPVPILHGMNLEGVGPADYLELATALDQQFGRLDGLVHCAAMLGELSPLSQYDPELWARTLHVNLNAPFLLNQVCLPLLDRAEDSRIIHTSDRSGRQGQAYWGAFGVAYAGVECMMQTLAAEVARKGRIRVSSLDPGPVDSPMRQQAYPAEQTTGLRSVEDVARAYVYLLSASGRPYHGKGLRWSPAVS
ncbi:SDR family NAD(P)-dependent oxidoreductase [Methylonatrum kenyense]|uniref:SDR family NAD(P)-dependent oxidoreductase n=1 Tax=Methylonatrum kenyense TaxID=455253 RepID=UPI0020C046BE|nr:SDR family NAD(P)-dependent oxidoreductase [Methylonatrum kenyense]MCK8515958.1 SDR family NAD(P)-dependent oxidoreductase [Methylonatrum kenyense]